MDLLWAAIKDVGASHNAEHQVSRGECLEGTREKVLQIIHDWRISNNATPPICWLSGAAGVGKSSIAITVAKYCEGSGLLSSFFFYRSDSRRNHPAALTLTIAHRLAITYPSIRQVIDDKIAKDQSILGDRFEKQFEELILKPISQTAHTTVAPNLVILDGLDECTEEQAQLRILDTIASAIRRFPQLPLRFLICSRPELWICNRFNTLDGEGIVKRIVLDDGFEAREDIRRYYVHEFQEIRNNPEYHDIPFPNPWPSETDMDRLVYRSDGQFSYAATTVRFVKQPSSYPLHQLNIVLSRSPAQESLQSPFHELDCLYHVVLAANRNRDKVLSILAAILIVPSYRGPHEHRGQSSRDRFMSVVTLPALKPECIELLLGLAPGEMALTLRGMHSVLNIGGRKDTVRVYHTSFENYLRDPTRSGEFYIDERTQHHLLVRRWLQALSRQRMESYSLDQLYQSETEFLFTRWIEFWDPGPKAGLDLLLVDELKNLDLSSLFFCVQTKALRKTREETLCDSDSLLHDFKIGSSFLFHRVPGDAYHYPPWHHVFNTVKERLRVQRKSSSAIPILIERLEKHPKCFHLELFYDSPGYDPDFLHWAVLLTTRWDLNGDRAPWEGIKKFWEGGYSKDPPLRITGCYCTPPSVHPGHCSYQAACLQTAKQIVDNLSFHICEEVLDNSFIADVYRNMLDSDLLQHCNFEPTLFSICEVFFSSILRLHPLHPEISHMGSREEARRRTKLIAWLE
ncbi:hypothetical protein V5O48_010876, partial [Marasmius crinis-equi]